MKILVVEDDSNKLADVKKFINDNFPNIQIDEAVSYNKATELCYSILYDFLLLDMNIPVYERNDPDKSVIDNGGEMIIRELTSENIRINFTIFTQYETIVNETIEDINRRLMNFCPDIYCGYVSYATINDNWKQELKKIIKKIYV